MSVRTRLDRLIGALRGDRPWDAEFRSWIREARRTGADPNDIGDAAWSGSAATAAEQHYLPHIRPDSIVLELGPGTGRYSRHVIGRCRRLILVDYSRVVCAWLERYLAGRGDFEVHRIRTPRLAFMADATIDFAFANGVFEHLDPENALWFLEEFRRTLRPGARLAFNFDNIMTDEGLDYLRRFRGAPGERNIFRFYHPDAMARLVEAAGLEVVELTLPARRLAFLHARRPPGTDRQTGAASSTSLSSRA